MNVHDRSKTSAELYHATRISSHPAHREGAAASSDTHLWNPLSVDPVASRFSSYAAFHGETVIRPFASDMPVHAELIDAHNQLRQQILGQFYPCVGAISAFSPK